MPKCKENCQGKKLFAAFQKTGTGRRIGAAWLMSAARDFCRYADTLHRLLCDISLEDVTGFIRQLYELESPAFTADDIHREINIINLFYDYLQSIGCVTVNPVQQLKQQEIAGLLKQLKARKLKSEDAND